MERVRDREDFGRVVDVSRETLDRLDDFCELLNQWQRKINLVSSSTLDSLWQRHIWDSAQLLDHISQRPLASVLDMGAGAGFPSLILATLSDFNFTLVEADGRKCSFLREAVRLLHIKDQVTIVNSRIESLNPQHFDIITCRAFAPLPRLLEYGVRFAADDTIWLLPKGQAVEEELTNASLCWTMNCEQVPSRSDTQGTILKLTGVKRV